MVNRSKLLSASLSITKHQWDTTRLAETNMKERESYENIQTLNYAYMQHLKIIFGNLQLAAKVNIPYNLICPLATLAISHIIHQLPSYLYIDASNFNQQGT